MTEVSARLGRESNRHAWQIEIYNPGEFMDSEYDLFEIFPDGSALWRHTIAGREEAISRLQEFALQTANEVRLVHLPTGTLIAKMNTRVDGKATDSPTG